MSEQESRDEDSYLGNENEKRSEADNNGGQQGNQEHEIAENPPQTEQRPQRVRFRSRASFLQDVPHSPPSEDPRTEWDKAQREGQPHRPSMPYSHESADITDQERTISEQAGGLRADEKKPEEKPTEEKKKHWYAPERLGLPSGVRPRWNAATRSIKQKMMHLGELVGRPTSGGDDLQSGLYRPDWASGGEVPLSDVTDNKHKTDEEKRQHQAQSSSEAHRLVRDLTQDHSAKRRKARGRPYPHAGVEFSGAEEEPGESGLRYRSGGGGILSQLMKLSGGDQNQQGQQGGNLSRSSTQTSAASQTTSGTTTPGKDKPKWYKNPPKTSTPTLTGVPSGNLGGASTPVSSEVISAASKRRGGQGQSNRGVRLEDEIRVTVHIAEIIARQRYIMQLCRALMMFGAPTHRLEEYMQMTAKVLEVDSQYLYLPGCMIMSFDDPSTRTTEVKLVRVAQGVDLARLSDTHLIYKNVIHDVIGIEEAIQELDEVTTKKPRFSKFIVILVYGIATATVGPFAFGARPIDLPIIFLNGCLIGAMQNVAAPRSALYSNIFEVTAAILTSFLSRAAGSIPRAMVNGKRQFLFCFSAISQSSIALILPGFLVLMASLELQSHQIIAGSIRMVYAIIYSLFLGYGITVGTTLYGLIDKSASSDITCPTEGAFKNQYVAHFPFVGMMSIWLLVVNQGKWKQAPPMIIIALSGYISNYFSTKTLGSNNQLANTVGAFTIGIMGNLYSRLWHGHAATAILPGIFVLVPSGLAATGSLISGVQSANQIRQNVSHSSAPGAGLSASTSGFSLGVGMIQVAIGISVGLFLSALIVYPYGKRRSGLFSF